MSENDKNEGEGEPSGFDWSGFVEEGADTSKLPQTSDALAKEFLGLRKVTGEHATKLEKAVFVPGEDATDDDRNAFYSKLGRPEKADDYGLEAPEDAGEFGKSAYKTMQSAAHKAGLSKSQLEVFHSEYLAGVKEAGGDLESAQGKVGEELKALWGEDYKAKEEDFNRAMNTVLGGEGAGKFSDLLIQSGMMQANPKGAAQFMDMARQIMAERKEGASPPDGSGGGGGVPGGGSARERFETFKRDKAELIKKGDKATLAEWNKLVGEVADETRGPK